MVTPSNAYVFSMPVAGSPNAKCMLTHELDGKRTTIKLW